MCASTTNTVAIDSERRKVGHVKPVNVVGVRVESPSNQPVLLLQNPDDRRLLPIWIGAVEATAIAFAQQDVQPPRPLTHDLLCDVLTAFDQHLARVAITDLSDGVFYAELLFDNGKVISARPSDAVAVALRTGTAVFVDDDVFASASVEAPEDEETEEIEVEAFREFLDSVSPEDFENGPSSTSSD